MLMPCQVLGLENAKIDVQRTEDLKTAGVEFSQSASATSSALPVTQEPRRLALLALTAGLITLCILLAWPFFPAITWSIALAIIAWPMHQRMARWVANPTLAALISTALVTAVIGGGFVFVTYQLARETGSAADLLKETDVNGSMRTTIEETPLLKHAVAWMDRVGLDLETEIRKLVGLYTQDLSGLAQGSMSAMIQCLVTVFILFHLFLDRTGFLHSFRELLPLSRAESERVFASAADSVHANLYATLVTSIIDTAGGGLMFWWLGLSAPIVWAVAMFILSILPVVGAGLVWVPAAVYLALSGRGLAAVALLTWGIGSFIFVDNFLYARLAGQRMRLHPVPALIAFLGGLAIFGISGMILGPAILALALAFLEVWKMRLNKSLNPSANC
jgi:predicted PurR-regulated permease PerM